MASLTTKTALNMLKKTEFLITSIRTQKPTINARLGEISPEIFTGAGVEGPTVPDWGQLQDWGLGALETSVEEVRRTDRDHRHNLVHLGQARLERVEQVARLKAGHRALRQSFTGTYGESSLALVGLDAVPARAFLAIREQMREAVSRMRDPEMVAALPEPQVGQAPIDLESLVEAREAEIRDLEQTTVELEQLRKRADESLVIRDESQKQHRRVYSNIARIQEGIYRLAGFDELADRIRATQPSARKKKADDNEDDPQNDDQKGEPLEQKDEPADRDAVQVA